MAVLAAVQDLVPTWSTLDIFRASVAAAALGICAESAR